MKLQYRAHSDNKKLYHVDSETRSTDYVKFITQIFDFIKSCIRINNKPYTLVKIVIVTNKIQNDNTKNSVHMLIIF